MNVQRTRARGLRVALAGAAILLIALMTGDVTWADPPTVMRYQARLTNQNGTPLAGNQSLTFAIYDATTAGSLLWNEGPRTVNLSNGNLDILLGQLTPLTSSVVNAPTRFLEITVGSTVLSPRFQLTSVAYSLVTDRLGTKTLGDISADNDARYPRLNAGNSFNGNQNFNGDVSHNGRGSFSVGNSDRALDVNQTGSGEGMRATAAGTGLHGHATGANGNGVMGEADGSQGAGVHGTAGGGNGIGVRGEASGPGGAGVKGEASDAQGSGVHGNATGGNGVGVRGESAGAGGEGIHADATSATGSTVGAHAMVHSSGGTAGVFDNTAGGKIFSGQVNGEERFSVDGNGNAAATGNMQASGHVSGGQMISTAAQGTAPLSVGSTTKVGNLNADLLDGQDAADFAPATGSTNYLSTGGGTLTGSLSLPANGLVAGSNQLVLSGGNVGIGTGSPASKLDVAGTVSASGDVQATGNLVAAGNVQGGGITSNGIVQAVGNLSGGRVISNAAQGTAPLSVGSTTKVSNLNADLLDGKDSLDFAPATGSTTYISTGGGTMTGALNLPANGLVAGANQLVLAGGNVGIGTVAPSTTLDVSGMVRAAGLITSIIGSQTGGFSITASGGPSPGMPGGNVAINGGIGNGSGSGGNITLMPGPGGSPGNVGVNTLAPAATLDVNGTVKAASLSSALLGNVAGPINIMAASGPNPGNPGANVVINGGAGNGSGSGGHIVLMPGAGSTPGNVGVNTSTPKSALDVNGTLAALNVSTAVLGNPAGGVSIAAASGPSPGNPGANIVINGGTGNGSGSGGHIVLMPGTGGTSGNVGVNTASPTATLDVNGTAKATSFSSSSFGNPAGSTTLSATGFLAIAGASGPSPGNDGTTITLTSGSGNGTGKGGNILLSLGTGGTPGAVGIGTLAPTNILTVQQNSPTDPIADAWTTYSSRRWKTNIETLQGALDSVVQLRGVSFDWKANGRHDIGLIAEEVGQVVPEVVVYEADGRDARSVDYARLVALLIEALKEQQKEIDQLRAAVEAQGTR